MKTQCNNFILFLKKIDSGELLDQVVTIYTLFIIIQMYAI